MGLENRLSQLIIQLRGEIEKAYAGIIEGDDIMSTLNDLNDEANSILADAIAN